MVYKDTVYAFLDDVVIANTKYSYSDILLRTKFPGPSDIAWCDNLKIISCNFLGYQN